MSKLNIYACSGVGTTTPQSVAQDIQNSGWYRNETLRKYLGTSKDGGCAEYFLYIFIPDSDLAKYNATIYRKRQGQLKTYNYVREVFVGLNYGTESDLKAIIRKGIEATFGAPVEDVLAKIRGEKVDSVGEPITLTVTAIISIVTAVLSFVAAIITGVLEYCKSVKVAQYTAPTYQEVEDSAPAPGDIVNRKKGGNFLLFSALAGAALLIFGKSDKSEK